MHLNATKNWESFPNMISGECDQRIFFWRIGCPCLQLDGLVPSVDWVEGHSTFKYIQCEIHIGEKNLWYAPMKEAPLKNHILTQLFFSSKMIRLGGWFFACFCHVLVQQGAGYSARVGASQLESGPTLLTGISTPVASGGFNRNGGTSRKGKPLKKGKFQRQSEWPLIPCDQDLKSN